MTLQEIIYDILYVLRQTKDDKRVRESNLMSKVHTYRSGFIQEDFSKNRFLNPVWLQDLKKLTTTEVNSADDPSITDTSISLGKVTLPNLVSLPEDIGLFRVAGSSKQEVYTPVGMNYFYLLIDIDPETAINQKIYYRIGNSIYLYPYNTECNAVAILGNPLEGYLIEDNVKRNLKWTDEYPLDRDMAQDIIISILTKEFAIEMKMVSDIRNDAQDQFKILTSGG